MHRSLPGESLTLSPLGHPGQVPPSSLNTWPWEDWAVAHIDVSGIDYFLSDGTQLLNGVTFKVPEGPKTPLIGPNGTGKTTLFKSISGDLTPDEGVVGRSGNMGSMRQFVWKVRDESTVRHLP